jgi:hypothetical protein
MTIAELIKQLETLRNSERLLVIEAASRPVRETLSGRERLGLDRRLEAAAVQAKDLYEPGGELTELTVLDSEEFVDYPVSN